MKKVLLVALMAVFTTSAFAQILTGKSAALVKENNNWSYVYLQYNAGSFSPDKGDSENFNAVSLGWNKNIRLTSSLPLYLETGLGLQFSFSSESESDKYYEVEENTFLMSVKVPVGVSYAFDIPNAPVAVIPTAGLDLRFNAVGTYKYEETDKYYDETDSETINLFDKDDMGGSDYTWNRFQIGAHIGVNARFWNKLLVGYAYQFDFSEISKKTHINQHNITIGYCF